jgi:uncharacterized lipoprotein YbaY
MRKVVLGLMLSLALTACSKKEVAAPAAESSSAASEAPVAAPAAESSSAASI